MIVIYSKAFSESDGGVEDVWRQHRIRILYTEWVMQP